MQLALSDLGMFLSLTFLCSVVCSVLSSPADEHTNPKDTAEQQKQDDEDHNQRYLPSTKPLPPFITLTVILILGIKLELCTVVTATKAISGPHREVVD